MRNLIKILVVFLLLGSPLSGKSQQLDLAHLDYRLLNKDTGLPSNKVTCFKKDSKGFMWVGTYNGLVRWDGSNVILFKNDPKDSASISGNYIKDIAMEGDSVMWVATAKDGLNKYNFKTGIFTRYYPNPTVSGSLPNEEVIGLAFDDFGKLWIGFHRAGFCKYHKDSDTFEIIALPEFDNVYLKRSNSIIKKFLFDVNNPHVVWLFTIEDLLKYNDETKEFTVYPFYDEKGRKANIGVGYGIQAENGKLYIPTYRKGVAVFDPQTESWINYNELGYDPLNKIHNQFSKIEQIDEFTFWVGSPARGMAILDIRKGYMERVSLCPNSSSANDCKVLVNWMDMSSSDGYWIGTNNGLRYYPKSGNQFEIYRHEVATESLKNRQSISSLLQMDSNGIYFGGYGDEGVYYYDLDTKTEMLIHPPNKFKPGVEFEMFSVRSMIKFNNSTILFISTTGLFQLNTKTKTITEVRLAIKHEIDYRIFNKIFKHSNGTFYITTRHAGIFILDANLKVINHLIADKSILEGIAASNYIYEITEDVNGNVWIGREDGFSSYNPNTGKFINSDYTERLDSIPQLKVVFKIKLAPDSSLWFVDARDHGVYLKYPYQKPYQFHSVYTGSDSLSERLFNVYFTTKGKTLITTTGGLSIVDKFGEFSRYNGKQGLPGLSALRPIIELSNGKIAMGVGNKLMFFNPNSLTSLPDSLPVYLTGIRVFNEERDVNFSSVLDTGIQLSYVENFFTISVGMLNFDDPDNYKLMYRLKGLNDEWIMSPNKKAVFSQVPGGEYVFESRFVNQNNKIIKSGLTMKLKIIPPFWETYWFRGSVVGVLILVSFAFYQLKIRSIKRENELKTEFNIQLASMELSSLRAQMNPHFIFNSINSIRHKIIKNEVVEADIYLVKFSRLVRRVLQNSKEELINLADEIDTLELYMALESSRFEEKFKYDVIVTHDICVEDLRIPPLIIQPYVENAIWHGLMQKEGAGKVTIEISRIDKNVKIVIEDNGVGRNRAKELKSKSAITLESLGIGITGNRLEIIEKIYQIRCEAEITDLKDQDENPLGTRVTLLIPLIYEV